MDMDVDRDTRQDATAVTRAPAAAASSLQRQDMKSPLISPPLEADESETTEAEANATTGKIQAVFVSKLYSMVEDPAIPELQWTESGTSFIVTSPVEFAKCLHNYFKHNNWQSFVRQLNMYQFHKVNDVFHTANGVKGNQTTAWEFKHTFFRRGCYDMLAGIKRKASKPTTPSVVSTGSASPREAFSPQPNEFRRHHPMYNDNTQDYAQNSIASIEASQRMLMDQNAAIFGVLRSYQAMFGNLMQMLASGQCSPGHLQSMQHEIHNLSNQLNHAQFPNRQHTHAAPMQSPGPYWHQAPPDSPSAPMTSPRGGEFFSPVIGHERDSYFRSPPLPAARHTAGGFGTPFFRSPVLGANEAKSPRWHAPQLPPIPTPPMSDTSRDGRDARELPGPSGFARPAMPGRGRSVQSLLNIDPVAAAEDRKRRRQEP